MHRRCFLQTSAMLGFSGLGTAAWAHHGWSSFDQNRPIYLEGRAADVKWRNPHAELVLELPEKLTLPPTWGNAPCRHSPPVWTGRLCWRRQYCPRGAIDAGRLSWPPCFAWASGRCPKSRPGQRSRWSDSPSRTNKGPRFCGPNTSFWTARPTACVQVLPDTSAHKKTRRMAGFLQVALRDYFERASKARTVMSSTEPVPLMARYFGAAAASDLAQLL